MMTCHVCGLGPATTPPRTLIRQNALGEVGLWACREHNAVAQDPEVERLAQIIDPTEPRCSR